MGEQRVSRVTLSKLAAALALAFGGLSSGAFVSPAWTAEIVGQKDDFDTGKIENNEALSERALDEDKITDVIGDQTMTQVGRGFIQGFQRAWREFDASRESNIAVFERPSARWGSLIWVEQNFLRVYQTFLFPGSGDPMAVGEGAARWVHQRIAEIEAEKLLFKDPDLEKQEF